MPSLKELDGVLLMIINWIITTSPVGSQEDLVDSFANVGYPRSRLPFGMGMQFLVVHVVIYYLVTKTNLHVPQVHPSGPNYGLLCQQCLAFPMTLKSVRSTGIVPESSPPVCHSFGSDHEYGRSAIAFLAHASGWPS
jgi:hypothetical protein